MSKHFVQNKLLRNTLVRGYRLYARAQFWRRGPRIYVNSIPKAGTHLLAAELEKFPELRNSLLHVQVPRPLVDAATAGGESAYAEWIARQAATVQGGQFFTGHNFHFPELERRLVAMEIKPLFMLRDPRDILVSRYHYIMGLRRHPVHSFLSGSLSKEGERYRALILGDPTVPQLPAMRPMLERFIGWMRSPATAAIRFEDLIGERGGGTREAKYAALKRICDHCGLPTRRLDDFAATPAKATATLRKGQAYGWTESLPEPAVELLTEECGDLIEEMGYPLTAEETRR